MFDARAFEAAAGPEPLIRLGRSAGAEVVASSSAEGIEIRSGSGKWSERE